jgi:CubicO group peptidase (beta-lactamase class C family)
LSLTSGFQLSGQINTFLEKTASLEMILNRPVAHKPGQVFSYDDIDIHLISLILARMTGMSLAHFAQISLFKPLGIWQNEQGQTEPWTYGTAIADEPHPYGLSPTQDSLLWSVDRQGNSIGGFGLQLTTREMAKLGYLYLRQGMWDGQQILPAAYVQNSLHPYSTTRKGEALPLLFACLIRLLVRMIRATYKRSSLNMLKAHLFALLFEHSILF